VRHFPLAAPRRERLAPGLGVTFHGTYAIYYRPLPDAVVIINALHGARHRGESCARTPLQKRAFPGLMWCFGSARRRPARLAGDP